MPGMDEHQAAWREREDQAQAELLRQVAALDDGHRHRLVAYLAGYAPGAVREALAAIESADQLLLAAQLRARQAIGEEP